MLDRRINKLKENLMRQEDEALVVRHLVDANPRGDDMLGEVCRAAVLLHPSASFEQALALARTMAYIGDSWAGTGEERGNLADEGRASSLARGRRGSEAWSALHGLARRVGVSFLTSKRSYAIESSTSTWTGMSYFSSS